MGSGSTILFGLGARLGIRRFAAGVDVAARGVTLAVLSQSPHGAGPVRVEWLAGAPFARAALAGGEIVDRAAVVEALREVFGQLPRACAGAALHCAMALPASVTPVVSVPLARLAPAGHEWDDAGLHGGLEPLVLAEAERVAGIERHELAVDWRVEPAVPASCGSGEAQVVIAATARQHLEARIECAAMAGITLRAMDGEAPAALRAMRHAASFELSPGEAWVALWVGPEGVHGWYVADDAVVREVRFPALEYADLVDALRDLARGAQAGCALISGDLGLLRDAHVSLADVGDVLGCPLLTFECATFADARRPLAAHLAHEPSCVVAFGLALRGVSE